MIKLNGFEVKPTIFPDKTSQVWKLNEEWFKWREGDVATKVEWDFENEAEFIQLAQLKSLLDHVRGGWITLHLSYLPYGRQDKEVSNDATFGLITFANMLNALGFTSVSCLDPHSSRAAELINNFYPVYPKAELDRAMLVAEATLVCYPDAGAASKYPSVYNYPYVFGEKVRDQATGNILTYNLVMDAKDARASVRDRSFKSTYDVRDKNILIIDDICDGGMTFILLAKKLYEARAKSVSLFVSHGIFSKGKQVLHDAGIKHVLTPKDLDE